ncbi:fatty acid desaturase [uncultured Litoreibacter sp.]|uniref:fatty acid desaturase n=1 Tax=uncultured Litoreibacter sp. TaxID=1392394 RepID=UPI0034577E5A
MNSNPRSILKATRQTALRYGAMRRRGIEWPTVALIGLCYGVWLLGTGLMAQWHVGLGIVATALAIALYSSLQHEVIHGHPFRWRWVNEALVFPALNLVIPYTRFRDTHLAHHKDADLTDPYDDPESNFWALSDLRALPRWVRAALQFNNTLLGRLTIGPVVAQVVFTQQEWRRARAGERAVIRGWVLHATGAGMVLVWLSVFASLPLWAYAAAAYVSLSIVKIRTFLEHQAHEKARGRTVIIEDRGPLAFLFLNNNFHAVHHMYPGVAWYRLPALYARGRERFLRCNDGYVFKSYRDIFRSYFLTAKDEVAHPLWHRD